jgi:lipopolysaccharide assembly outer membrane protein LptD (OstA)
VPSQRKFFTYLPKVVKIYCAVLASLFLNINSASSITSGDADTLATTDSLSRPEDSGELKSKIHYTAQDSIRFDMEEEKTYLNGAATVDYEDLHLQADRIVLDWVRKEIYAEGRTDSAGTVIGRPEFAQGGEQFRTSTIRYNFDSRKGKLTYLVTQEGEGYIHGEAVKKDRFNDFYIRNGQYTTCDADTPHFSIAARRLKLVNTGTSTRVVTGPAFLTLEGVPTPLLIPFGFFPNTKGRNSGIIFPSFGESASRGFYFQHLGYYFGFSDYLNLALTTDLYTLGSYSLTGTSVYAKRYRYRGQFSASFSKVVVGESELPDYQSTRDFHIGWTHQQDAKASPYSSFSASVNAGSSTYYRNNLSSPTNFLNNTLQSSISYSRLFPGKPFNLGIALNHYQNTSTHDIRITAPDVSFGVSRISPFKRKNSVGAQRWYEKIGASYTLRGTNYIETKDSLLFSSQSAGQFKNGLQHVIPVSTTLNALKYFSVSPSFNYSEKWYYKTVRYDWDSDSSKVDTSTVQHFQAAREWNAAVSMSTRIYGMFSFRKGPVTAIRHVMTPALSYSYRPDFGSPAYGYYRTVQTDTAGTARRYSIFENTVYGGPASGKSGSLGFSLDNNLEMKVKADSDSGLTVKKIKLLESLRISGAYNFAADSMRLSVLSLSARTSVLNKISFTFSGTLNPYAYDANGKYFDRYLVSETGKLVNLTNAGLGVDFSLNGRSGSGVPSYTEEQLAYFNQHPDDYVDFNIPYNLRAGYKYNYSRQPLQSASVSQTINLSGDMNLTPRWKIGFYAWYDFETHRLNNASLNFFRDLHCWEMRLNWIPFGQQESYSFQINVKSAVLQDLKWVRKKDFYDR